MIFRNAKLTYFILAVATGLAVSGIYIGQTLLGRLAEEFKSQPSTIGLLVTITQVGYALGIFFLVPLGDMINKKKLSLVKMITLSIALYVVGASTTLWQLFAASLVVGVFASVAQDFVPIGAEIAPPKQRGQVVGLIMSGLLVGILASRTVSGWLETTFNWHWVFWTFSFLVGLFTIAVYILVPSVPVSQAVSYRKLMSRLIRLPQQQPRLLKAVLTHGLVGLAFSSFWTNLSFYLSGPDFKFSSLQIGLFGLAGAAGALAAPIGGRLADTRGPAFAIKTGIMCVMASFALMIFFPQSIIALIMGAIVFDAGAQMSLISHQSIVFSLDAQARSSLNAFFVTGMFISFAIGSALSTTIYGRSGWMGVLTLAFAASFLAFILARAFNRPPQNSESTAV